MPAADEVPVWKRLTQIVSAIFFCLTTTGVIFGYAALKPVLLAEGVYQEECEDPTFRCVEQDAKLNLMFTLSVVCTNVAALPIGFALDRIGPQKMSLLGAVVFATGNFLFGLGLRKPVDTYLAGYILLALGGPMIFLSSFHLSNAFPAYSGSILSAITGAFDASSLPYVIYRTIYSKHRVPLRTFFWFYMIIAGVVFIQQLFLGCSTAYGTSAAPVIEETPTERTSLLADRRASLLSVHHEDEYVSSNFSLRHYGDLHEETDEQILKEKMQEKDPVAGMLFGKTAKEQIGTSWFWLIAFFLCIHMCRINFYIETANEQLYYYTRDAGLADTLTTAFTLLLPLGGIAGIPFVGTLLDKRTSFDAFLTLLVFGFSFGLLTMMPSAAAQIAGICFFVILRPLMYTAVSDYTTKIVGFKTFGTVYGLCNSLSGLFGLIQYPLDLFVKFTLKGSPTIVNVVLLVLGTTASAAVAWRIKSGIKAVGTK